MSVPFRTPGLAALLLILCGLQNAAVAQYGGPSILSRGGNQPGRRGRAPVNFTAYLGSGARYESGLIAPVRAVDGQVPSSSDVGYTVEGGLYGGHDWRSQSVGLDYRGDYRWQRVQSTFNGTNHALAFDYIWRPGRRLQFFFRETGGTTNRAFGSFSAPTFVDSTRQGIPLAELYDVRTYFAQSGLGMSWMKSPRLQISMQADVFFVKRKSLSLINSQGVDARMTAMYRLTRATFIGGDYQFYKFDFPRAYSGTEAQGPSLRYRHTFGRRVGLDAAGGILFINSFGTENVKLSPEVAEILGRTTTVASFVRTTRAPNIDVSASYTLARGAFRGNYSYGIGAGNGVYLATKRNSVNAGYSFAGIKRTSLGISGGWTRTDSASLNLDSFDSAQIGMGFSYKLADSLNLTSSLDFRRFSGLETAGRNGIAFSITLSYSTSRLPLSIW